MHCRLLRAKGVNGTYLIRAGSRAGSEKVLSVWHEDRCRHYKLFKDEVCVYYYIQSRSPDPTRPPTYWVPPGPLENRGFSAHYLYKLPPVPFVMTYLCLSHKAHIVQEIGTYFWE